MILAILVGSASADLGNRGAGEGAVLHQRVELAVANR